ncbi:hypothetical protein Tco_1533022 [Tanacetum coccineum]
MGSGPLMGYMLTNTSSRAKHAVNFVVSKYVEGAEVAADVSVGGAELKAGSSREDQVTQDACEDVIEVANKPILVEVGHIPQKEVVLISFASFVTTKLSKRVANFHTLDTGKLGKILNFLLLCLWFWRPMLGMKILYMVTFLGKRIDFPVVKNYVMNVWKKFGITKVMMISKGLFFSKFKLAISRDVVLKNGSRFIRNAPIIPKK